MQLEGQSVIDAVERALDRDEPVYLRTDGTPEFGEEATKSLRIKELELLTTAQASELAALREIVNTPLFDDFIEAVKREEAHQIQRWGRANDRSKSAENWFWLVGYLASKALRSVITGDMEKAKHHCISSATALKQWHAAICADKSGSGIGEDEDLKAKDK